MSEYLEIADKITAAFAQKRVDGFSEVYADDVVVWHNTDQISQCKTQNLAFLKSIFEFVETIQYSSIVRTVTSDGFIQEHRLDGTFKDGRPIPSTPVCMIVTVRNGLIARINEYVDPAKLIAALEQPQYGSKQSSD